MLFGHASPDAKDLKFKIGNYKLINPKIYFITLL